MEEILRRVIFMYTIRKKFTFEMAHQLSKAYSAACSDCIHGHSYILELFFSSPVLDRTGMVIDFGEIKTILKSYIDKWDHAIVMHEVMNPEYLVMLQKYNSKIILLEDNPTAEVMTRIIFGDITNLIQKKYQIKNFKLSKVRLHETTTGYAEYFE